MSQTATLDELRNKVKSDLYLFAKWVLGYTWLDPDIHGPICRMLENSDITRLRACLPRGWYKTTLCSIAYPIWEAIRNPNIRILLAQNTITNAVAKLRAIDDVFKKNELFKQLFHDILPDKTCVWRTDSMCVLRDRPAVESTFEAAGTRTKVVSRHYDIIIEDDTVAPDQDQMGSDAITPSKEDIEQAIGFHRLCAPLLVDVMRSKWIVVGTRWYERDLISWIDEHQRSFVQYTRACREVIHGVLQPSFPVRFPNEALDKLKEDLGPYMFSCLYMNQPIRADDMIFQKEWFQPYWAMLPPIEDLVFYTSADPAGDPDQSKRKNARKRSDWNVVLTTARDLITGRKFVVEYTRKKCNPSVFIDMIFDHVQEYKPVKVGIETVAYQQSIMHYVKQRMEDTRVFFMVEPLTHNNVAKNIRIQGLQPLFSARQLQIAEYMKDLQAELESFPLSAHDDLSDALAMHLELWGIKIAEPISRPKQVVSIVPDSVQNILDRYQPDYATDVHAEFFGRAFHSN